MTKALRHTKRMNQATVVNKQASIVASLKNASKRYGDIEAVSNLSLDIYAGEVVALLGPNGAGKTSSVSMLLGLIKASSGQALLFDKDPQTLESRMRTGVMLQLSGIPDTLKVKEHIELYSAYYPKPLSLNEVLELAALVGLENRWYGKLSGGQKQRLHLALAMCGNPDLVFLDEPTTGLDVASRRALWQQVRGFIGQGRTVVLTTHYLEEADALADRIIVINKGKVIAEGSPTDIKAKTADRKIRIVTRLKGEDVSQIQGVTSLKQQGSALEILVTQAESVVAELLQRDPNATGLEVTSAGLEDAFLALTEEKRAA